MCLLATGCATAVGVRRIRPEEANRQLTANVLTTGQPGAPAQEFLYRLNLSEPYAENPAGTIAALHAGLGMEDESRRLFALAELSFDYAERGGGPPYYLASAAYAWAFLFPDNPSLQPDCYDPRVRTAMDLYNRGVAEGLISGAGDAVDLSPRSLALPYGTLQLDVDRTGFDFVGYQLVDFVSLADLDIYGLRNRYRQRGIGAPLAASVSKGEGPADRWIGPYVKVPVTALLRFDDPRRGMSAGALRAKLQLYYAGDSATTQIGNLTVPLESEKTTALAYQLDGAPIWDFEIAGFRRGDLSLTETRQDNLFMFQPYRPGRIPVVFVHGTASSPARWAEMTNELMNDPILGQRYQFWFYLYNTGNPVAFSAMGLREGLQHVVKDVDPEGLDPALREMVVIGHSQGGLLTKMTVVNSGTRFWDANFEGSIEEADLSPETKDLLRRSIFVEPLPFVTEVIFICTPHRGSFLAENYLGKIARSLVTFPAKVTKVSADLVKLKPVGAARTAIHMPTAIDNMDGSHPFIKTLSSLPIAPGVEAHSIVAVQGDGPPEEGDDGVVKYTSAHIEGVASEFIVRDSHSTQATPATIEEVRRLLYAHLKDQ